MIRIIDPGDTRIRDLPTVDTSIPSTATQTVRYPISIVNRKTFKGPSHYIGRHMAGLQGSALANQYKVRPHGPFTREHSVLTLYRKWLWREMQDRQSAAHVELIRLTELAQRQDLVLSCWCAPALCHGSIIKNAIEFLIRTRT